MCKNFTRRKIQSKLAQKLLSMLVSFSLMAGMVPLGGQNFVAEAEVTGPVAIPYKMFATADDLKNPKIFSLAEENDDKVGRVVFGRRPQGKVKYYSDNNITTDDVGSDDAPTPMTWLIAGWDTASKSSKPGLVLYSEKPMVSAKALDDSSDSRFQGKYKSDSGMWWATTDDKNETIGFVEKWGSYVEGIQPKKVYANHWGASNARKQLKTLEGWFTSGEKKLMQQSTITTTDVTNENKKDDKYVDYTTDDTLYALRLKAADYNYPNNTAVTAGEADDLVIDKAHWGGVSWLRSPIPGDDRHALLAFPGRCVNDGTVGNGYPALAAACKINLESDICESVIFASAASAANLSAEGGAAKISQIDINAPMYLHLDGSEQNMGTAMFNEAKTAVTVRNAQGTTLIVQGVTDSGANWSYHKNISSDAETITVDDISGANADTVPDLVLTSLENCKVWLEKPVEDGGTLTYAVMATDFVPNEDPETPETPGNSDDDTSTVNPDSSQDDGINTLIADVTVNGQPQRIIVRGPFRVLPRGTKLVVEVAPPHEELDDQGYEIEQQTHYNIWLLNEDGTSLPMPLPEKVELLFQILKNGNGDDLEIVLVTEGEDIQFEENTVEIDGIRYRRAYTDHFSPYSLLDKLTEEEKNALNAVKTGDELTYVTISGLGLVMTLALGLMLNSKINRKKSDM